MRTSPGRACRRTAPAPWHLLAPERMSGHVLQWLVGMPAETHPGILGMALGGAFEKLPPSLKPCFCHGGAEPETI